MPLKAPNLDDRTYADLRHMGLEHIRKQLDVEWSDLTPGDPGVVLLEVFAYLTDQMIYRLNRVPQEKVYVALLRLLGVSLYPPAAAMVTLEFRNLTEEPITIRAGTQVTVATGSSGDGGDAPIFITLREQVVPAAITLSADSAPADASPTDPNRATMQPGMATVSARHCRYVQQERFLSTGEAGQLLALRHKPVIAPSGDEIDLLVEVEEDGQFVRWEEVTNFSQFETGSRVYIADRVAGTVRFAPAVNMTVDAKLAKVPRTLAAVPSPGTPIRVSYAYGGGNMGNVAAQRLTTILPSPAMPAPIPGLRVTNPVAAVGGQDGETLANALQRGPQEIYSLERAITARDFERLAVTPGMGIGRAKAFTQLERWAHGTRGTVEIRLVPNRPTAETDIVQLTRERQQEGEGALEIQNLRRVLIDSQPMGTAVDLQWANYKHVWVEAHVTLKERTSASAVRARLLPALDNLLTPLPQTTEAGHQGWPFGQTLYSSDIHRLLVEDEGVDAVTQLQLCVAAAPDRAVSAIAVDQFQANTWYAASDRRLFRSFNDGEGWELVAAFPEVEADVRQESIRIIEPSADLPGLVAVWVHQIDGAGNHRFIPFVSSDCGERWHRLPAFSGRVEDVAWIARETTPIMLLATDQGLFKLEVNLRETTPTGSYSAIRQMKEALHAVAVIRKDNQIYVAIALQSRAGVYLANGLFLAYDIEQEWLAASYALQRGAESDSDQQFFRPLESDMGRLPPSMHGEDIRSLDVQYEDEDDPTKRVWLWAGAMAVGWEGSRRTEAEAGRGCFVWEINTPQPLRGEWHQPTGWVGGSCRGIAFQGDTVLAVSQWGGVLRLAVDGTGWQQTNSVALPRRGADVDRNFAPLIAVAANRDRKNPVAIAGGAHGLYATTDRGATFSEAARTRFDYRVTLPTDWLFISGEHRIVTDDSDDHAARGTSHGASHG